MFNCIRFVNSCFNSNTYLLVHSESTDVWLVDPGDMCVIFDWLQKNNKQNVAGILLTHSHFDHIYGINDVLVHFPDCPIYVTNEYGRKGLFDTKQNGSKYTEYGEIIVSLSDNVRFYSSEMSLWQDVELEVLLTQGHSDDSACLCVGTYFFTGDTLIKDVRTVTKLKSGSVEKLRQTLELIKKKKGRQLQICPGHGELFHLDDYDLDKAICNPLNS